MGNLERSGLGHLWIWDDLDSSPSTVALTCHSLRPEEC